MTKPLADVHSAGMRDSYDVEQSHPPDGFAGAPEDWQMIEDPAYRFWPVTRAEILAGVVCAVAMAASGLLLGLLWAAAAPRLDVRAVLAGSEIAFDAQAGIDVYFAMICAVGGVVGGAFAFWRGRDAGWPVPAGLTVGGIGGSGLASWIGHLLRSSRVVSQLPDGASHLVIQLVDFRLRSPGFCLVLPAFSLFVLAALSWLSVFLVPRRHP
ncbi:hypothetical protein [Frankia sp. Cppng1_Ct_nod]|uniref:hypothetical protein n=1 Tax=Frankia sp. Cppng1_Ct_nod TaxID=2897162 RepID=UPI0010412AAE|nr:hypothetical protein [Frankia sp. Cppng1_Ct_nod]